MTTEETKTTNQPAKKIDLKEKKQILSETLFADDNLEPSLAEKLREKKKLQKKKSRRRNGWSIFGVLFALFLWWGFMPLEGTIPYALCKIVLELNTPYPTTLRYTEVTELSTGVVRIWFAHIDGFGESKMETFSCAFGQNPETGNAMITQAKKGNLEIDPKQLETFNKVMPYLVAGNYYNLEIPSPLPNDLSDLKFETEQFRKIKLTNIIKTR